MLQLILISIFLVPIISALPMAGTIVWYPQLLALMFIGLLFLSLRFWKFNKFISLLLMYESFSYLFITSQNPRTMLFVVCAFSGVSLAYAVSKIKDTKMIFNCIIAMSILQSIYVVLQSFNIDFFFHGPEGKADVVGFAGSHNQIGAYSAAVGAILASLNPLLVVFSIIPIYLAKQNGALIGLLAGMLLYTYFSHSKTLTVLFIILIIVASPLWLAKCGKTKGEIMERVDLWKNSISQLIQGKAVEDFGKTKKIVTCNPFFGFGFGNFFTISPYTQMAWLPKDAGHVYEHAHNDLVEALYEFGYIGFIIVLLCISSVVAIFVSSVKSPGVISTFSCLFSQSVASCSVYVFHAPLSLFMFCLTLGLFYAEVANANKSPFCKDA